MMKRFWYVAAVIICAMVVTSCGDDDDDVDEVWKEKNRKAFYEISTNPEYKEIKTEGNSGSIYYKVLKQGTGTEQIYYTSTIGIYYTGTLVGETTAFAVNEYPEHDPSIATVSSYIEGFNTALQHMKEGDRWEVWIPHQLAYGTSGNSTIPGFSTLIYEIEVASIKKQ